VDVVNIGSAKRKCLSGADSREFTNATLIGGGSFAPALSMSRSRSQWLSFEKGTGVDVTEKEQLIEVLRKK
jgi:hypothetical protein